MLRRLNLSAWIDTHGMAIDGMLVTGPGGVRVEGRYPIGFRGRSVARRDFDFALVTEAVRAGAQVETASRCGERMCRHRATHH